MRCGKDAHGNKNNQNGCGKSFQWSKANPYRRGDLEISLPSDGANLDSDDFGAG